MDEFSVGGTVLRKERERRGLTGAELGKMLGCSRGRVSHLEHSAILKPRDVYKLDKIFEGTGWRHQSPTPAPVDGDIADLARSVKEIRDMVMRLEVEVADLKAHRGSLPKRKVNRVAKWKAQEVGG